MAKLARFPRKMEIWVPEAIAEAFEVLASDQMLTISDHARQAFRIYLAQLGALQPRPVQANGQHHQVIR